MAAWLLFVLTFPLVFLGGLVTTYQAGMAVPGWPGTYGYNLFLYPVSTWFWGPWDLFIEHGHRLLGAAVGFVSICLVAACWLGDARPVAKLFSLLTLTAVIGQGVLGGMRVLMDSRVFAQIHGCTGPCFFAMTAVMVVLTGKRSDAFAEDLAAPRQDRNTRQSTYADSPAAKVGLFREYCGVLLAMVLMQLILGSFLRHQPPGMTWRDFQMAALFHVTMAIAIASMTVLLFFMSRGRHNSLAPNKLVTGLLCLICVQIGLGLGAWVVNYGWPDFGPLSAYFAAWSESWLITAESMSQSLVTTSHQALGALFLALSAALCASQWLSAQDVAAVNQPVSSLAGASAKQERSHLFSKSDLAQLRGRA